MKRLLLFLIGCWLTSCIVVDAAEALLTSKEILEQELGVLVVQPNVGNVRLSAQRGLFLIPKNLGVPFEQNLKAVLPKHECSTLKIDKLVNKSQSVSVIKFVFANGVREEVARFLEAMGVTSRLILPDLQGVAESVTRRITGVILH